MTWGDAADLVAVLDVRRGDDGTWTGAARAEETRPVVEASQILGQAVVAAMRHAPGRRVVSAHLAFVRVADAHDPVPLRLAEVSSGRSFTALDVRAAQHGRTCATGTLLLGVPAPDVVDHAAASPDVAGPDAAVPYDMGVAGREIRVVDATYSDAADAPVGPPVIDAWVRFASLPDDPALHAGLMAQFTGHMSLAAALRPHAGVGQVEAHRTLSMGVNAIALGIHAEVRADDWLLYHHLSTSATGGMTRSECRVHDEAGALVASFAVDAMLRPMRGPADDRTAL